MNPEQIHDALNLLDDTVIAPVEKLRNRRKPSHHAWTRWICAACICIAAAYTIATWKLGLFPFDSQYADKTIVAEGCTDSLPLTSYSVLVEIQAWQINGFSALITNASDTPPSTFSAGDAVTVLFSEYIGKAPDRTDFLPGTVVCIQFKEYETVYNPETGTEHILYAKVMQSVKDTERSGNK